MEQQCVALPCLLGSNTDHSQIGSPSRHSTLMPSEMRLVLMI